MPNYLTYKANHDTLQKVLREAEDLRHAWFGIKEDDVDDLVIYKTELVSVRPNCWFRSRKGGTVLPQPAFPRTELSCRDSAFLVKEEEGRAVVTATSRLFFSTKVYVDYKCPSRIAKASSIERRRRQVAKMPVEKVKLYTSPEYPNNIGIDIRFKHPLVFISHRWLNSRHPDPDGEQLRSLRALKDCYLVYDFTSFPQKGRLQDEEQAFRGILASMDRLIENVVILHSPDYMQSAWCLYEYIVASMKTTIVFVGVADPSISNLYAWVATRPQNPLSIKLTEDSWTSHQRNYINQKIVESVNSALPLFHRAVCTNESDKEVVRGLLLKYLKLALPAKKKYMPYMGDWETVPWTDEELASAFQRPLDLDFGQTVEIRAFDPEIPNSLEQAAEEQYIVRQHHQPIHGCCLM